MQNNGFYLFERGKMYDSTGNEYNITNASYTVSADDIPRISIDAYPTETASLSKGINNAEITCNILDEYVTKDSLQETLNKLIADVKLIGRKRDIREKIGCLKLKGTGEVSCSM